MPRVLKVQHREQELDASQELTPQQGRSPSSRLGSRWLWRHLSQLRIAIPSQEWHQHPVAGRAGDPDISLPLPYPLCPIHDFVPLIFLLIISGIHPCHHVGPDVFSVWSLLTARMSCAGHAIPYFNTLPYLAVAPKDHSYYGLRGSGDTDP